MMKKVFAVLLAALCVFSLYAGDGDHVLTRKEPSNLLLDAGLAAVVPSDDEGGFRAGAMAGITFTPASYKKFAIGVKLQFAVTADPGELKNPDLAASGFLTAKFSWARSFELYGAMGARYGVSDFKSFSDFSQRWGLAVQAGAHGRQTDRMGVGVEAEYFKCFTEGASDELGVRLYLSYEI